MRYTKPVICNRKGDLTKSWYVEFYFLEKRYKIKSGQSFGVKGSGNRMKDRRSRTLYFQNLVQVISDQLKDGWSPDGQREIKTIQEGLEFALSQKKGTSESNYLDYRTRAKKLLNFLQTKKLHELPPTYISKIHIKQFLSQFHGKNYNNYLKITKGLFTEISKEMGITLSPCKGIDKQKFITKQHETYPPALAKQIIQYTSVHFPDIHVMILLEYYCFMRPTEIRKLETKDIDLEKGTITVRASKSGKVRILPIHQDIAASLRKRMTGQHFLLTVRTKGGINNQFYRLKRQLEIPDGYTLYSFKHTGVCALYLATKDIYLVSRLCGHASIQTTQIYLRSLGQDVGYLSTEGLPSMV